MDTYTTHPLLILALACTILAGGLYVTTYALAAVLWVCEWAGKVIKRH